MDARKHLFTPNEKKMFLDILKKYNNIIENKDTDGASLRAKNDAWDRVTAEFNASPIATSQASSKQMRRLWINIKQRQRQAITKERQHRIATGGGPSINDAEIDPEVSVIAPALIVGIDSAIDSDAVEDDSIVLPLSPMLVHDSNSAAQATLSDNSQPLQIPPQNVSTRPQPSRTRSRDKILDKEYQDRSRRAQEKHNIEILILKQQLKEATAKASLAELILKHKQETLGNQD